jgi:hypothetical protein
MPGTLARMGQGRDELPVRGHFVGIEKKITSKMTAGDVWRMMDSVLRSHVTEAGNEWAIRDAGY